MHPKEIKIYVDRIYELYGALYDEFHKLKRENKMLLEEMGKIRQKNVQNISCDLHPDEINKMRHKSLQQSGGHHTDEIRKIIKMGATWCMEGDKLISLSLMKEFKFHAPISNVKISDEGKIIFSCNKKIILYENDTLYTVDDVIKLYDMKIMKNDLVEFFRCVFAFMGESIIVFYRNNVIKFTNHYKIWSIPIMHVVHIEVTGDLIYIGTKEPKILVFRDSLTNPPACVKVYNNIKLLMKGFRLSKNNIIVYNDFEMLSLNDNQLITDGGRIVGLDIHDDTVYYGNGTYALKACNIGAKNEITEKMNFKKPIVSVKGWKNYVIVGTQDRLLYICDIQHNKWMRIMSTDCVIDMSVNENTLCCVGNNGTLKVWQTT